MAMATLALKTPANVARARTAAATLLRAARAGSDTTGAFGAYGATREAAQRNGPWLRIKQNRLYTDVSLTLPLAPGQWWTIHARVEHAAIKRVLQRSGVEIGFSLGGLWKGIKKVAKATGVTKVLNIASKVLKNPIVTAVFPVASIAARATEAGVGMLNAVTAAKKGTPAAKAAAVKMVKHAQSKAKGGDPVAQQSLNVLARAYKLVVLPLPKAA